MTLGNKEKKVHMCVSFIISFVQFWATGHSTTTLSACSEAGNRGYQFNLFIHKSLNALHCGRSVHGWEKGGGKG